MRFDSSALTLATPWMVALIVVGMSCHFGPTNAIERLSAKMRLLPAWAFAAASAVVLLVVEGLRGVGVAPFIYFQF
jgi:FtsH-binding integral membrane protein